MVEEDLMPALRKAAAGDQDVLHALMEKFRKPLARMVQRRMDRQMASRVDASDVVQDSYLEAWKHLAEYVDNPVLPFIVWLRQIVAQQTVAAYRTHVVAQMRSAHRETSIERGIMTDESQVLADRLEGAVESPSDTAMREERRAILVETLNAMEPDEREILTLRHFDGLNSVESAEMLGISAAAASKRYIRAIKRLQGLLHERKIAGDLSFH